MEQQGGAEFSVWCASVEITQTAQKASESSGVSRDMCSASPWLALTIASTYAGDRSESLPLTPWCITTCGAR